MWAFGDFTLVAHYEFEDNANDSSSNNNHGTAHGGVTYVSGKIGKAAQFDGVDDNIESKASINTDTSFTVAAWVKPYSAAQNTIVFERGKLALDQCGSYSAGNYGVQIYSGKFTFETSTIMQNGSCSHNRIFATSSPQINQYYFVTARYDKSSSRMELFINGVLEAQQNVGSKLRTHSNAVLRMSRNSSRSQVAQTWHGELDEIRIYNRALSDQEIKTLYQLGQ